MIRFNLKDKKIKCLSLILAMLISSLIFNSISNISENTTDTALNSEQNQEKSNEIINDLLDNLKQSQSSDWWNSSWRYRTEVKLEEPGFFNRTNEPVDVYLSFQQSECHEDTIRVLERNIEEIPSQVWNISMYDTTYIESATITFLANVNKSDTVSYYIYYSDTNDNGKILNPKEYYMSQSGFSSTLDELEGCLSVTTTEFDLELQEGMGIYNFSKGGVNYHTNNSLAPWMKAAEVDTAIYHPDSTYGGAIHNWLVLGRIDRFNFFNPDWNNPITATKYHIDITKQYVEGDYATGGDAVGFLDPSVKWSKVEFSSFPAYSTTHGYNDINDFYGPGNSGNPEYKAFYASCYIRSPVDLNNVYLKVGSDDGIKVIRDGQVIWYNHVLRSPAPDREAIGPMNFEAGRWYYFIVIIEENTGQTGFHFRFSTNPTLYSSNPGSDPGKITNLDIAMRPPLPIIESITEISNDEIGPIFSRYEISWEEDGDMRTSDTITIYNDFNLWKCERHFWWTSEQRNTNFSVIATIYDSNNDFNRYLYDEQWTSSLSDTNFTPENYTIVWGDSPNYIGLGIFVSAIEEGGSASLDQLDWAVDYNSLPEIINLRPGNQTNLNNGIGGSSNYIEITFWEYINDNVGTSGINNANETFVGIYNTLKNPLMQTKEPVEASFFDLTVNVTDHDGNVVEGVNVYIYNATTKGYLDNQTTDENGLTTFARLPQYNYTLNATFSKYGQPEFPVRGDVNVSLDMSKTIVLNNCNLTSLNLELRQTNPPHPLVKGADVDFYLRDPSGDLTPIGTEISDDNGKVNFVWENLSQSVANISVRVIILGEQRQLNNTPGVFVYYLNYTFTDRTEDTIGVLISSYSTELLIIAPIDIPIDYLYKGQMINITVKYNFTVGASTDNPIANALVSFNVLNPSLQIIGSGVFNDDVLPIGYYNVSIDTNAYNIIAGGVNYYIDITARLQGYTPQTERIAIQLLEIWTNLTASEESKNIVVPWNGNITVRVYYNDTLFGRDIGLNDSIISYNIPGRTSGFFTTDFENGTYELILNSSLVGRIGDFVISISAFKTNYVFQEIFVDLTITAINSELTANVTNNRLSVIWNKVFSIEITFNDTEHNKPIPGADVSFTSLTAFGSVGDDFVDNGDGTYLLIYNTTEFPYADVFFLTITATGLDIYADETLEIRLEILPIPTRINGQVSIVRTIDVFVGTPYPLEFNYNTTEGLGIRDAIASYEWQYGSGAFNSGSLVNGSYVGLYLLDFNTELRTVGSYSIVISFSKVNYESRTATIILNIVNREIDTELDADGLKNDQINIVKGKKVTITLELRDASIAGNPKISGADVVLDIGDEEFEFDEEDDGVYELEFDTKDYEAFITSFTLTGEISIKAANYSSETLDITIVIEMEEIYPGIPTFYFIMISGAIAAVVGSLATYRYIQVARIPSFVKKTRKIKKAIKSSKAIEESLLYPSKEEYMIKRLDDKYQLLGLSMEDTLGIKGKKGPTISQESNSIKKKEV